MWQCLPLASLVRVGMHLATQWGRFGSAAPGPVGGRASCAGSREAGRRSGRQPAAGPWSYCWRSSRAPLDECLRRICSACWRAHSVRPCKIWGMIEKAGPVVRSFFLQQAPLVKLLSWVIAHNDVHIQQGGGVRDIGLEDAHLDEIDAAGQDIDIRDVVIV